MGYFLIFILISCKCGIYFNQLLYEIPKTDFSFCTYRMNYTHFFGCSGVQGGNTGNIMIIRSLLQMQYELSQLQEDVVTFVIPPFVFTNLNIINQILKASKYIAGVVVLEPDYCTEDDTTQCPYPVTNVPTFSERNICEDSFFKVFANKICYYHKLFGYIDYVHNDWPFPVILLYRHHETMQNIIDCFENYNVVSRKGENCKMTINNFTPHKVSSADCIENTDLQHLLTSKLAYCSDLSGYNIYITVRDPPSINVVRSFILITTKMDTSTMFDTASTGTMEIYPSVSLMMYLVGMFTDNVNFFGAESDVLIAFLDNDSVDDLGSLRMIYDLKENKVSDGSQNISDKNIKLIISLSDFSKLKSSRFYVFFNQCERSLDDICNSFIDALKKAGTRNSIKIYLYQFDEKTYSDPWIKHINVPKIIIRTSVMSSAVYQNSFLDRMPVKEYPFLRQMGLTIAEAVIRIMNEANVRVPTVYAGFNPNDMASCFYRISCRLMRPIIGPLEKYFYMKNADPFISQAYVDGEVTMKQGEYSNRLSYFILKMLVYYFHRSFDVDKDCHDLAYQNNFSITVMDELYCFKTRIQVMRQFNPLLYAVNATRFITLFSNLPVTMRSNIVMRQSVKLYISVDNDLYTTAMVFATLIASLSFVGSIFLYRSISVIIPPEIF